MNEVVILANIQLISKYNKGIRYLLCVIDLFGKYAWVVLLKNKKGVTTVNPFRSILDSSIRKPSKVWIYQGSGFYNKSFKQWLEDNDTKVYSTYNERKFVGAERFLRTLKNNISKHMTAASNMLTLMF